MAVLWLQIGGHARHLLVATALHSAAGRRSDLTRHSGAGTLGHQPGSLKIGGLEAQEDRK